MYIARILYPVKVLGPGNRIGIWFDGCEHHCKNCSNPELWEIQEEFHTDMRMVKTLIESIRANGEIDGFTLTGGDPFYQPEALKEVVRYIYGISHDILCYTGYSKEYLWDSYSDILEYIGVLIDGKYIEARNNGALLRGSDNQRIIIINNELEDRYRRYFKTAKNSIQNFRTRNTIISVGIHKNDYPESIQKKARELGLSEAGTGSK